MKVHILGSAGWIPGRNETCCVMVENKGDLLLLDAGTGMANLYNYRSVLASYDRITVLLSHYHLDHTIGLMYLSHFVRDKVLRIYGPGKPAYPETTDAYLRALLRREFYSHGIDDFSEDVRCLDFPAPEFTVGQSKIRVTEQIHSSPSFRIAVDDSLIYATDTVFSKEQWENVSAGLLLHECWDGGDAPVSKPAAHTALSQLMDGDFRKKFGEIVLIHQNPDWTQEDRDRIRDRIRGTNLSLAEDGMSLEVPGGAGV